MGEPRWPICTAHYRDCGHAMLHESEAELRQYAKANLRRLVTPNGWSICACHPEAEAVALGVDRFDCGDLSDASGRVDP